MGIEYIFTFKKVFSVKFVVSKLIQRVSDILISIAMKIRSRFKREQLEERQSNSNRNEGEAEARSARDPRGQLRHTHHQQQNQY